jgi:hypothetical protein
MSPVPPGVSLRVSKSHPYGRDLVYPELVFAPTVHETVRSVDPEQGVVLYCPG